MLPRAVGPAGCDWAASCDALSAKARTHRMTRKVSSWDKRGSIVSFPNSYDMTRNRFRSLSENAPSRRTDKVVEVTPGDFATLQASFRLHSSFGEPNERLLHSAHESSR